MSDCTGLAILEPETVLHPLAVGLPVSQAEPGKFGFVVRVAIGFAEEMGQGKAQVKHRVTPVDRFVIQQNQLPLANQYVFRAEVAMDQRDFIFSGFGQQLIQKCCCFHNLAASEFVIGFQPQGFEEGTIPENRFNFLPLPVRIGMNGSKQSAKLPGMVFDQGSGEQQVFPVVMR